MNDVPVKWVKVRLPEALHLDFRRMCLECETNMQERLEACVEKDVTHWKKTGKLPDCDGNEDEVRQ